MIVVATINLGVVHLGRGHPVASSGIGLQPPAISWGVDDLATPWSRCAPRPHMLLFPSLFLSLTVLAFIMLGDAVRDAFDPKTR